MSSAAQQESETEPFIRAAIDIGSNSIKLLVAKINPDGTYKVLRDSSLVTGLGRGVSASGELSEQAVSETLSCIRELVREAKALGAKEIRAAATAAVRSASNPEAIIAPLNSELGLEVEVLSGEDEAELSRSVSLSELRRILPVEAEREAVFFDLGGGSTELTLIHLLPDAEPKVLETDSMDIGARRMTELAGITQPVSPEAHAKLVQLIDTELAGAPTLYQAGNPLVAGLGGTASVLVWLRMGLEGQPISDPHGATISLEWIDGLITALGKQNRQQVLARPNLDPLRADIIYAGAVIIQQILVHYRATEFLLLDRGLRYGLLLED